jgi:HlyD family secretion protein
MLNRLITLSRWRQNSRLYALTAGALVIAAVEFWRWQPVEVPVLQPETNVPVVVFGLGQVDAERISQLGFEVDGVVAEIAVQVGDHVRAGDMVARLDSRREELSVMAARQALAMAQAQVRQSAADVASAEANLALKGQVASRASQLERRGTGAIATAQDTEAERRAAEANRDGSLRALDVARARVEQSTAQLSREEETLARHKLLAPFDGIVLDRLQNIGAAAPMGTAVLSFMDPKSLRVLAYVDEGRAGMVKVGQRATVTLRSRPAERLEGRVDRIDPRSDKVTEERRVYITFDAPPGQIFLDEQAEARIEIGLIEHGTLIPELLIRNRDGAHGTVWAVVDGRLQELRLTFGRRLADGRMEVVSPIPADARIVGQRMPDASPGMTVRVADRGAS